MLEFVDSGLYFVQDENNLINPLLQVGSGSKEKSIGSGGRDPHPWLSPSDTHLRKLDGSGSIPNKGWNINL